MTSSIPQGVSVILCCYNSSERLIPTLKHLAFQNVSANIEWEVILVDNNSTDETKNIAMREWQSYDVPVPFKVITEFQQGLIYARKKGACAAKYPLLLFCDDDNWLERNYISHAYSIMCENEKIGILGGKSTGFFEVNKPLWFDKFQQAYAVGIPLQSSGVANKRTFIAGAGMVVRKDILDLLNTFGFKPLLTGRKGRDLTSGEDSELCLIAMFLGYDLYYDEKLQFVHFITRSRLTWRYCINMITKGHSIPQIYFDLYHHCYNAVSSKQEIFFYEAFRSTRKKMSERLLKLMLGTRPFGYSFRLLIHTEPGSRKEVEIKSLINKLIYLFKHKRTLKEDFADMAALIKKIHLYKSRVTETSNIPA